MIAFRHVSKSFGSLSVLRDFNLELKKGEHLCVVGPSGQGKSTVLNLAAGLLLPDSGSIARQSDRISYVFQEDRLLPWQTALQNVALVSNRETAQRYLAELGLGGFLGAFPSELSGGMARRVSIARALAFPADLYLFDEPFKGWIAGRRTGCWVSSAGKLQAKPRYLSPTIRRNSPFRFLSWPGSLRKPGRSRRVRLPARPPAL